MGKASKWFRGLFGLKKSSQNDNDSLRKRRWSFVKSYREKNEQENQQQHIVQNDKPKLVVSDLIIPHKNDTEKNSIAAVESAVIVRLKSRHVGVSQELAAIRIQSAFRGSLARKALRALKGLVKIQALVRGHIERKRTAEWLHRMQVMLQAQARAIAGRSELSKPNNPFANHPGPSTPEKVEHVIRSRSKNYQHIQSSLLRRNSSKSYGSRAVMSDEYHFSKPYNSDERSANTTKSHYASRNATITTTDEEKSDRIVEIDAILKPKRRQNNINFYVNDNNNNESEASFCTADDINDDVINSPQYHSATSSRGPTRRTTSPFAPSRSDGSASFLSGYSDFYPSYMGCTESSRARSVSAPKQRPTTRFDRSGSAKREPRQKISAALHAGFVNKAYPGSGRLDKLGMPLGYNRYY